MKFKLNPAFTHASGALGEMVFRQVRGKVVVSRKGTMSAEPTAGQTAHRARFKQAAAYGKSVMADEGVRALYEEVAKAKDVPVFALTIADFFNVPSIVEVDASNYNGQAGGTIKVITADDFGVVNLNVVITDADEGNVIETGQAVESPVGTGYWLYTATSTAPAGILAGIQVTATDRPGGTAVQRGTKGI